MMKVKRFLRKLSVKNKMIGIALLANVIVLVVNVILMFGINSLSDRMDMVYKDNLFLEELMSTIDRVQDNMTEYLNSNDHDFDVLYSENDNMTFGAMRAMDEAGITYGEGGQVKIITFDASKKALQYCLEGKIDLCVECNPMHGPIVEQLIRQYRAGDKIPKHVYVDEAVFTRDDLTQELIDSRDY